MVPSQRPDRIWAARPEGSPELHRLASVSDILLKLKPAEARWAKNDQGDS